MDSKKEPTTSNCHINLTTLIYKILYTDDSFNC